MCSSQTRHLRTPESVAALRLQQQRTRPRHRRGEISATTGNGVVASLAQVCLLCGALLLRTLEAYRSRSVNRRLPRSSARTIFYTILILLAIGTLVALLARVGPSQDYDPLLDPMANPNIRINEEEERFGGSHL